MKNTTMLFTSVFILRTKFNSTDFLVGGGTPPTASRPCWRDANRGMYKAIGVLVLRND